MFIIDSVQQAASLIKSVERISLLESCRSVQSFGDLVESLSVNTLLIVLSEIARRVLHQIVDDLFASV